MIEVLPESKGNVLGIKAIGTIRPVDYDEIVPMLEDAIRKRGAVRVLFDLSQFNRETIKAWKQDFEFGREFHRRIEKAAIVGDKTWEKWLTVFVDPFYAQEARYFHTGEMGTAWKWLRE